MTCLWPLRLLTLGAALAVAPGCVPPPASDAPAGRAAVAPEDRHVIVFDRDAGVLPDGSGSILDATTATALAGGRVELRIAGAIDASLPLAARAVLGTRRATAIHDALIARGVSRHLIVIEGACSMAGFPPEPGVPPTGGRTVKIVIFPPMPQDACGAV